MEDVQLEPRGARRFLSFLFSIGLGILAGADARAQLLYGATGSNGVEGELYQVDPANGTATLVGNLVGENGPIGITGLAFHPITGVLYGVTGSISPNDSRSLVTINTQTAAATVIGALGGSAPATDISFASDGTLYGWLGGNVNEAATINLSSGAATPIGDAGVGGTQGGALAFNPAGLLYVALTDSFEGDTLLRTVNIGDGSLSAGVVLSGITEFTSISSMVFDASGNLYGVNNSQGEASFVTIDETSGAVTTLGELPLNFDGLAFEPGPRVTGRQIFYNGSSWDGDFAANASDDSAIATDKTALLPGQTATFANYTSFHHGINGIMIDGEFANSGAISAGDFLFKVGNDNTPATWINPASAPTSVTLRAGAGLSGSDRITIIWPNNAIQKQWLQVTVLPSANTGLSSPDVFYFGNAVGESGSGNTSGFAQVNLSDEIIARNNLNPFGPVPVSNPYDYNRDKRVNLSDEILARLNQAALSPLRLITVP